ncbi:MAG: efflux RND transporter permease subunit [Spirochaetaceae bacterium]|jgi:multidrug efflux pump subunit AcrB|nr:efflux RND transporter permease subunit [Spirochaetaceae bacterium]
MKCLFLKGFFSRRFPLGAIKTGAGQRKRGTGKGGAGPGGSWLEKPVAASCAALSILAVSLAVIGAPSEKHDRQKGEPVYGVILRHYGVDGREMERSIALPLEEALSALPGLYSLSTVSENGRVRAFARFTAGVSGAYEAFREAVQRVSETLPSSVQRPELVSGDDRRLPVWSAVVVPSAAVPSAEALQPAALPGGDALPERLGVLLERELKPAIESLEGSGEVELAGTGLSELVIALKNEAALARNISPSFVASFLGAQDILLPGGELGTGTGNILINVDGRYRTSEELADALIPIPGGGVVPLNLIADVYESERTPESISRLDGKPAVMIAVMSAAQADLAGLSKEIKRELERFKKGPPSRNNADRAVDFFVLSDRGAEEARAYASILKAAISGALMVALASACFASASPLPACFAALAVPFMLIEAAALLSVLGFSLDRMVLAGLASGAGSAVDAAILCTGGLAPARTLDRGRQALSKLLPGLVSSSVTTIAALIPLLGLESLSGGVSAIAWAAGAVTLSALLSSIFLLPPLLFWDMRRNPGSGNGSKNSMAVMRPIRFLSRRIRIILIMIVRLAAAKPLLMPLFWLLVSAAGFLALFLSGASAGSLPSEDSVYARVEFRGGVLMEEVDRSLIPYAESLRALPGIRAVQTSARPASGSVLVSFDPDIVDGDRVREAARAIPVPGGFVYIPEAPAGENIWEITIAGDDDDKCRSLAVDMARLCSGLAPVLETVLNFKEGSRRLSFMPDRERLAGENISFAAIGDLVRRSVEGPVAYKRVDGSGETDVRVRGLPSPRPFKKDLDTLYVLSGNGPVPLDTLVVSETDREISSIRREDRRRTAGFSVRTKNMDPRKVREELASVLEGMELPPGYSVEFDREAVKQAEALSGTFWFFVMALFFCYLVIGAVHESFTMPLVILAVVPPSLALPALCIAGSPVSGEAACAFVAVSGMAVNAAVLCAGELSSSIMGMPAKTSFPAMPVLYRALRKKFYPLLATTLTTVLGSIPFLFLSGAVNTLVRTLALVSCLGVGSSAICALTLLPSLAIRFPSLFRKN